jgi:cell division septal protein FtsQ
MTDQERIEQLKTVPPRPPMTRGQRVVQVLSWLCSAIAIASMCVAVYATQQAWHTASCVNSITGDRNPISARDAQAHVAWAKSLAHVLAADKVHVQAAYVEFVKDTNTYLVVLTEDQQYRDAHPLGRC